MAAYRHLTGPERVRAFARTYLEEVSGGIVRIEGARFDLFEGLHLRGVVVETYSAAAGSGVATGASAFASAPAAAFEDRLIFSSRELFLKLRPFSLVTGDLVVPEIVAIEPILRLARDPETDLRNWDLLRPRSNRAPRRPGRSPAIRMRNATVDLAWTRPAGGRETTRLALDVTASGTGPTGAVYDVRWRTRTEPMEAGRFALDMTTLHLQTAEGGLPTIPMASVRWAAPLDLERWIDVLDLRGQVQTGSLLYDPSRSSRAEIALHEASLSIPVNDQDRAVARDERYLNFTNVRGRLVVEGPTVTVALEGAWRGGICRVAGRVFADVATMGSLDDLGLELEFRGERIPVPVRAADRGPAEDRFVRMWPKLVDFCELYSPTGRVDVSFALRKAAGRGGRLEFGGGTLVSRGANAAFAAFPYRLTDLRGTVHFQANGQVHLDHLVGRHGSAQVSVDGWLTSPTTTCGVDLQIEGRGVELDETLYACLSSTYRAIWEAFDPRGFANIQVNLHRPEGAAHAPPRPWESLISADLLHVSACYEGLPLPMTNVRGRIEITPDRFVVDGIDGCYREASWSVRGQVGMPNGRRPGVNLELAAREVPVDEEILAALPEDGQRLLNLLGLRGRVDVRGKVRSSAYGSLDYDLAIKLGSCRLRPAWMPVDLRDVTADARATPREVTLQTLTAHGLSGTIAAEGVLPLGADRGGLRLNVMARGVGLSRELFEVLPASVQEVWQALRPAGQADIDFRFGGNSTEATHLSTPTVEIRPLGATIAPVAFPVQIDAIDGVFQVSAEGIHVVHACGRLGTGRITLRGAASWNGGSLKGQAVAEAKGLAFDDALRRALPWRARRAWNSLRPTGTFDISLRQFAFSRPAGRQAQWTYDGAIVLHGVDLAASAARELDGTIEARGTAVGAGSEIELKGLMDLRQMRLGDRLVRGIRGELSKKASESVLSCDNIEAAMYGGHASGSLQIQFEAGRTTYGLSIAMRDVSLLEFLEAGRKGQATPVKAQGIIGGTMFLEGTFGETQSRQGAGSIRIDRAQVMKIPLFLAVLGAIHAAPMDENAFNEGTADFVLQGNQLTLSTIDLRGTSVSLVGAGSMNTATEQLEVTLVAGSPHRLPRLGLLTELAEGAARELMETRVTGSLYDPHVEARPLSSLRRILDAIGELRNGKRKWPAERPRGTDD